MRYYKVNVVIRPDDREGPEREAQFRVKAQNRFLTRRIVFEQVWQADMLVTGFRKIVVDSFPFHEG